MPEPSKSKSTWHPDPTAYCPVKQCNEDSFIIYVPGQRVIEVHLGDNGIVNQIFHYHNGSTNRRKSFLGILTLAESGVDYEPSSPIESLLPINIGDAKEITLTAQGTENVSHRHRLAISKKTKVIIGKCRYDTIEVHCYAGLASSPYGLSHTHTVDYSPDLGISLTHRAGRHGNILADREVRHIDELQALLKALQCIRE